MFNLSPKNDKFFDLFISFSDIINESAVALKSFVEDPKDVEDNFKAIKAIETKGDEMLHNILEELNDSFITPLDREDIYLIAKSLDDLVDYAEDVAGRFYMYDVNHSRPEAVLLVNYIVKAAEELKELMIALKDMKKFDKLKEKIVSINKIENDGDVAFRKSMRSLFINGEKELQIMIWKDIFEKLEKTIDSYERLANVIEGVVMKHA